MQNFYQKLLHSRFRKPVGIILVVVGLFALLTPLTPGSWLALIGLELLGWRLIFHTWYIQRKRKMAHMWRQKQEEDTEETL